MIRLMGKGNIFIWMVRSIKVNGLMINSMDKELNNGLMEPVMKENICKVKNITKETLIGQMDLITKEISMIIILKVLVHIPGLMVDNILDNGLIIKCMVMVNLPGLMAEDT